MPNLTDDTDTSNNPKSIADKILDEGGVWDTAEKRFEKKKKSSKSVSISTINSMEIRT